jgi:hypothetical protein
MMNSIIEKTPIRRIRTRPSAWHAKPRRSIRRCGRRGEAGSAERLLAFAALSTYRRHLAPQARARRCQHRAESELAGESALSAQIVAARRRSPSLSSSADPGSGARRRERPTAVPCFGLCHSRSSEFPPQAAVESLRAGCDRSLRARGRSSKRTVPTGHSQSSLLCPRTQRPSSSRSTIASRRSSGCGDLDRLRSPCAGSRPASA